MVRILLAEDDASMRAYLARALERAGYEVVAVDRGTAALPLIEAESFELLLTDIVMPEMDGIELAQKALNLAPGHHEEAPAAPTPAPNDAAEDLTRSIEERDIEPPDELTQP